MKIERLLQLYEASKTQSPARINRDARFCLWPGQAEDGRKWKKNLGYEPVPFDGCSDSRPALVDLYIQEDKDFLVSLAEEAQPGALPVEPMDAERANRATMLLRWMVSEQIAGLPDERELAADYMLSTGKAVAGVFWKRERRIERRVVTMEAVLQAARSMGGQESGSAALPELILNEAREEEAAAALVDALGDEAPEGAQAARRLVRELREKGEGQFTREVITREGPEVQVYAWGDDFLAPPGTTDVQKAPAVFVRQWFTADQIATEGHDYGWSEAFLDRAAERLSSAIAGLPAAPTTPGQPNEQSPASGLLEVVTAVHWKTGGGAPELWVTTFAPELGMEDGVALEEPLGYAVQAMPFVVFTRERLNRRIEDSRGYGQIAHTWQRQYKASWDLRTDRNYLTTVPPLFHPPGRRPSNWGPGVRVPRVHQGDYEYAQGPNYNVDERALEETVLQFCDRYFGKPQAAGDSQAMVRRRALAARWLRSWRQVYKLMFQLCQQFLTRETYVRVAGSEQATPLAVKPEDIRGSFDVQIYFDPDRMDVELMKEKIGLISTIIQLDAAGIVDRTALMRVALNYLDPKLSEMVLRPAEAATQAEIDDEDAVFAKLSAYVGADVRPGQAYGLRLRRLQQIAQSPSVQARLAQDKEFAALVEKRVKQLEFQLQQQQNAIIGKLGA